MKLDVHQLTRTLVKEIIPYSSARSSSSGGATWLNANENPTATSIEFHGPLNRYPDCQPRELCEAYAAYAQVNPEQILVTRGADEGIELLVRTFCEPVKDCITLCPPTYGMYAKCAEIGQVFVNEVALTDDYQLDLEKIFATNPRLIFLCSPNNPTGNCISIEQIINVLNFYKTTALVVVDEAYIEFAPETTVVQLLKDYPHLVILRTLSKAFALAGLRCGFTIAHQEVIASMRKIIAPYPIPVPVAQIALEALSVDQIAIMRSRVRAMVQWREEFMRFAPALSGVQRIWPSRSNFVWLQVKNAKRLVLELSQQGVAIRDFSHFLGLNQMVRITIGDPTEMQMLRAVWPDERDLS